MATWWAIVSLLVRAGSLRMASEAIDMVHDPSYARSVRRYNKKIKKIIEYIYIYKRFLV